MTTIKTHITNRLQQNEAFVSFIKDIKDNFSKSGTTIFSGRNTIKTFDIGVQGTIPMRLVVKHFKKPDILKKLSYGFAGSTKADRAFDNGQELLARGISTPEPYAAVDFVKYGLPQDYYLITSEMTLPPIENGMPYHENTGPFDKKMAEAFAMFIAELHSKGILHHDLNRTNVLYSKDAQGEFHFSLIDINRMKFYDKSCNIPLEECMENMTRFTARLDIFEYVARHYAKARGFDESAFVAKAIKVKKSHDAARRHRKIITHPLREIADILSIDRDKH